MAVPRSLIAVVFYGLFGGFVVLAALGAAAGTAANLSRASRCQTGALACPRFHPRGRFGGCYDPRGPRQNHREVVARLKDRSLFRFPVPLQLKVPLMQKAERQEEQVMNQESSPHSSPPPRNKAAQSSLVISLISFIPGVYVVAFSAFLSFSSWGIRLSNANHPWEPIILSWWVSNAGERVVSNQFVGGLIAILAVPKAAALRVVFRQHSASEVDDRSRPRLARSAFALRVSPYCGGRQCLQELSQVEAVKIKSKLCGWVRQSLVSSMGRLP